MVRLGLTGGIGSGKSTVSRMLAERGAPVVDADLVAREVVAPGTPGLAALVAALGPEVLQADGSLDRERVASLVFGDPERLKQLNAVVHPLVGARMAELEQAAVAAGAAVVVHDVPLLAENGLAPLYDEVVVVDCPVDVAVARLVELRGMTENDARARVAAQATREQRLAVATHVVDNSGSREQLEEQVRALWERLSSGSRSDA